MGCFSPPPGSKTAANLASLIVPVYIRRHTSSCVQLAHSSHTGGGESN